MKDRIISIMEHEGLIPSKFAEAIGIQRASISHIMNGRNNPSYRVLTKILECYPHINSDWLFYGKGKMLKDDTRKSSDLFENLPLFPDESTGSAEYGRENTLKSPQNSSKQTVIEKIMLQEKPSKTISKIMVFYSDNTFDTFVLDKNK